VNQHEQDYKNLFEDLKEMKESVTGDDLHYMRQMKDI
jgi:hypothetical protein